MSVDAADQISAGSVPQDGGCHTEYPALKEQGKQTYAIRLEILEQDIGVEKVRV